MSNNDDENVCMRKKERKRIEKIRANTGTFGRSGSGTCVGMSVSARSELSSASGLPSSIAYSRSKRHVRSEQLLASYSYGVHKYKVHFRRTS